MPADATPTTPPPWRAAARRALPFVWVVLPLVALLELATHVATLRAVPGDDDWRAARAFIAHERRDGDLVTSAPVWTDPLARQFFNGLITLEDAARPDATRYRRAFVATIRDGEHPDLVGWPEERTARFGPITVRVLRNPHPVTVLYDFVEHVRPPDARVVRADNRGASEHECGFHGGLRSEGGGLGQGALAGPERFVCGDAWNYVGRTILEDMDHRGRLCIWSHPVVDAPMRTTFHNVRLGAVIRGYHAVAYEAERGGDHGEVGAPITLRVRVGDQVVGEATHADGDGWKPFAFDVVALSDQPRDVTFEVTVPSGGNRHYCFEADTR